MQDEKKLDRYHVECPLYGKAVEIERCVDIHDVVHRIRIPSILLKEILEIENFREICWNCPQHHFEKNELELCNDCKGSNSRNRNAG